MTPERKGPSSKASDNGKANGNASGRGLGPSKGKAMGASKGMAAGKAMGNSKGATNSKATSKDLGATKVGNGLGKGGAPLKPSAPSPSRGRPGGGPARGTRAQQAIPDAVANRMARRIAIATGVPTLLGMGVFVGSYLLVSRHLLDIPPSATLLASGGCFLLGLVGLSYGVLSASWEDAPGSLLGREQIPVNFGRLKASLRALRDGGQGQGNTPS